MRVLLLAAGWLAVVALGALEVLCRLGVSRPVPLDWLWAFTPYVFLPVWLLLVVALVAGARSLTIAAALVAAGHLALLWPAMSGSPAASPAGSTRLRIATANVLYGNADATPLAGEL